MYVEPHPFLSVVYKRNALLHPACPVGNSYPLHRDSGYSFPLLRSNNYRHVDGPLGDRDFVVPRPLSQFRVLCLGASTTGNYVSHSGRNYSYPLLLEEYLRSQHPGRDIVVYNGGRGGWTSAEILVNFLLSLVDLDPSVVVLYHAYNDLGPSLTPGFVSDYSHARQSFGESAWLYRWFGWIPYFSPRRGLMGSITRGRPDLTGMFSGLAVYRRNIESLIQVCLARRIRVVLSTFACRPYDSSFRQHVYQRGVGLENSQVVSLASQYALPCVDNARLIPDEERYFFDSVHFTPAGMTLLARNIGEVIDGWL